MNCRARAGKPAAPCRAMAARPQVRLDPASPHAPVTAETGGAATPAAENQLVIPGSCAIAYQTGAGKPEHGTPVTPATPVSQTSGSTPEIPGTLEDTSLPDVTPARAQALLDVPASDLEASAPIEAGAPPAQEPAATDELAPPQGSESAMDADSLEGWLGPQEKPGRPKNGGQDRGSPGVWPPTSPFGCPQGSAKGHPDRRSGVRPGSARGRRLAARSR